MVTGVILAGGGSSRYGRNKALEDFRGERLVDRCVAHLIHHTHPLLVVTNDLAPYYGVRGTLVQDIVPHQGPLGGILTALLFSPHGWIFVKAVDMPFFVPELFTLMTGHTKHHDVVVPMHNGHYEPLFALYSRRCLPAVLRNLERKERRMAAFYRKLRVKVLSEKHWKRVDPEGLSFKNINTLQDMVRL